MVTSRWVGGLVVSRGVRCHWVCSMVRTHGLLAQLDRFAAEHAILTLTDTGNEGAPDAFRRPHKKPKRGEITDDGRQFSKVIGAIRALTEKANAHLKVRIKALRRASLSPGRTGDMSWPIERGGLAAASQ